MAVTFEKLPDEPIVIVTSLGQINVEMMLEIYRRIAEIADQIEPPLYRITDTRQQDTSFADMMGIIKQASRGQPGTTTDPRIRHVFVGRDKFAMLARDAYANNDPNHHAVPVFDTLEEALAYIRLEISRHKMTAPEDHSAEP